MRGSQEERGSRLRGKYGGGGYQSQKTPMVAWISLGSFFGYWIFGLIALFALGRAVMQGGMTEEKVVALGTGVIILALFAWLSVITGVITGIIAVCMKNRPKAVGTIGLVLNGLLLLFSIARTVMKS